MNDLILQAAGGFKFEPMMFLLPIMVVFYLFILRPQQKKQKERDNFVAELSKGQKVVTAGGIYGKVVQVNEENSTIILEIAEGTKIKIDKSVISQIPEVEEKK